jgi:hypothetical protein
MGGGRSEGEAMNITNTSEVCRGIEWMRLNGIFYFQYRGTLHRANTAKAIRYMIRRYIVKADAQTEQERKRIPKIGIDKRIKSRSRKGAK